MDGSGPAAPSRWRRIRLAPNPVLRRLAGLVAGGVLVVVCAIVLLFALTLLVRGNPAAILLGPRASPEAIAAFTQQFGLDQPLHVRLLRFFAQILQGDLGTDFVSGRPILGMVIDVLPYTVVLTFTAIGLAVLIGVPLGCYAATHRGSLGDRLAAVISVSFIAMPNFVVAVYLVLIFSIWLDWLPVLGVGDTNSVSDQLVRLILPAVSLALGWVGYIARLVRSSLLEVLGEPYIRTARAYGQPEWRVLYKYALKNAAIPTVAILGLGIGRLLGGAIFAEIIFARPGIGTLVYDAIQTRNYPIVQAGVLVVVTLFVVTNIIVDMSYAWIDPRMRQDRKLVRDAA